MLNIAILDKITKKHPFLLPFVDKTLFSDVDMDVPREMKIKILCGKFSSNLCASAENVCLDTTTVHGCIA